MGGRGGMSEEGKLEGGEGMRGGDGEREREREREAMEGEREREIIHD